MGISDVSGGGGHGVGKTPGATGFPWKTVLAVVCLMVVLLGWRRWKNHAAGLDPAIFREAAVFHVPRRPEREGPLNGIQASAGQGVGCGEMRVSPLGPSASGRDDGGCGGGGVKGPVQGQVGAGAGIGAGAGAGRPTVEVRATSPVLEDGRGALDAFYAALWVLEQGERPEVVTVLHYGDSPTTADLITGDVRAMLQRRFGDAGHGFNLVGKPWAWYGHRDVEIADHGWKAATGVGSMREGVYGLGGATLTGGVDARSTFRLKDASQTAVEVEYLSRPGGGSFRVLADDAVLGTVLTEAAVEAPESRVFALPRGTKAVSVVVAAGEVKMFGVDFRKGDRGVVYDSLGLNGASTTVLSRTMSPGVWAAELKHARPSLVVINYGTNESSFPTFVEKGYEAELRGAVGRVRAALPGVPILIMSPMDRGERGGLNEIHTMSTIPEIVRIQRRVAEETGCAFFDTFDAMGGSGTFARWYAAKPRLVTADLIHPTPAGAYAVAELLIRSLSLGYDQWKAAHGLVAGARPVPGPR